jgi:formyltetrahydrofolate synthetase
MAVLLKDALMPNILQTIEHVPAFVHAGPFANIAHGNSSVLADEIALRCVDYVVTEAGFGADMGFEKFCNIKCRTSGKAPDAAVLVVTVRAIKAHSDRYKVVPGRPIDPTIFQPNVEAVLAGVPNMQKHLENIAKFNLPCVVAINRFSSDGEDEIKAVADAALVAGAFEVAISDAHVRGGAGAAGLAEAVVRAANAPKLKPFKYLYDVKWPIKKMIETIATEIYGADGVAYEPAANRAIETFTRLGFNQMPICMSKTQYSLSHDDNRRGRPTGFKLPIRDIRLMGGAGFLTPLAGTIQTMPAFGRHPAAMDMDIDENGRIRGLF